MKVLLFALDEFVEVRLCALWEIGSERAEPLKRRWLAVLEDLRWKEFAGWGLSVNIHFFAFKINVSQRDYFSKEILVVFLFQFAAMESD